MHVDYYDNHHDDDVDYIYYFFNPIFILYDIDSSIPDNPFRGRNRAAVGVVVCDISVDPGCIDSLASLNVHPLFLQYLD